MILVYVTSYVEGSPRSVVVSELDFDIVVSEFELQSLLLHFRINSSGKV